MYSSQYKDLTMTSVFFVLVYYLLAIIVKKDTNKRMSSIQLLNYNTIRLITSLSMSCYSGITRNILIVLCI